MKSKEPYASLPPSWVIYIASSAPSVPSGYGSAAPCKAKKRGGSKPPPYEYAAAPIPFRIAGHGGYLMLLYKKRIHP